MKITSSCYEIWGMMVYTCHPTIQDVEGGEWWVWTKPAAEEGPESNNYKRGFCMNSVLVNKNNKGTTKPSRK